MGQKIDPKNSEKSIQLQIFMYEWSDEYTKIVSEISIGLCEWSISKIKYENDIIDIHTIFKYQIKW